MIVQIGAFNAVTGVIVANNLVSILNSLRIEHMIDFRPHYDRELDEFVKVMVTGEFGDFRDSVAGQVLIGLEPRDITEISILPDELQMKKHSGEVLSWELYKDV